MGVMRSALAMPRALVVASSLAAACGPSVDAPEDGTTSDDGTGEASTGSTPGGSGADDGSLPPSPPATSGTTGVTSGPVDDTAADTADESTGAPPVAAVPSRLLVFYTPHGYYEEHAFAGGDAFGPMLAPLTQWQEHMLVVQGIENVAIDPEGIDVNDAHSTSSAGLLTGGLLGSGSNGDDTMFNPHFAGGPSLDVVLGENLSEGAPFSSVHLGVRAAPEALPLGVSYLGLDAPNLPLASPSAAFASLFGGLPPDAHLDALEAFVAGVEDAGASDRLAAHMAIASTAFLYDLTRVQLVTVDVGIPRIRWTELGVDAELHEVLVLDQATAAEPVYTLFGERLADFVAELDAVPQDDGTSMLDHTLVVWLSDMGSTPAAHTRGSILAVILDKSGTFATGNEIEVRADQADLAATIAAALDVELGAFGHPDLAAAPIPELLAP
jgi:hypothetical protein